MYDLVIIGAGPAGLTAALYAARKKLSILVLTKDLGGQVMLTKDIENYMGYQFVTGQELVQKFEDQLTPILEENTIRYEAVRAIRVEGENLAVLTEENVYAAKSILIASGKRPRPLDVPGETKLRGRGVSYCATCDGPLFKKKDVAVIGGGNSALQAALELSRICGTVYLADRSGYRGDAILVDRVKEAENIIGLRQYRTKEICGAQVVEEIVFENSEGQIERIAVGGVFIEAGLLPNTEFLKETVVLNERGEIVVDCRCHTSIPGIFAAGDVTDSVDKQIVIAAGDGAKAAMAINEYLFQRS